MSKLRNAACWYADMGWHVLPLRPGRKQPLGRLVPNGKDDATADLAQVFRWWDAVPSANIGIHCYPSGLVVLDVDPRNGGDDSLYLLERELGTLPETVSAETGGGGFHYFFRDPGCDLAGVLADGLDVKRHGYVLVAPSVTTDAYTWDLEPGDVDVADLPANWLDRMRHTVRGQRTLTAEHDDPLRNIAATIYVPALTGRVVNRGGYVQCPFHSEGNERTPSLKCEDTLWACHGCRPLLGKQVCGGNVFDLAGLLLDRPLPLRGIDYREVRDRLERRLLR